MHKKGVVLIKTMKTMPPEVEKTGDARVLGEPRFTWQEEEELQLMPP